jgi:hypothetical protein
MTTRGAALSWARESGDTETGPGPGGATECLEGLATVAAPQE